MPLYDFMCKTCSYEIDEIVLCGTTELECPECGGTMTRVWRSCPKVLTEIIPSYPGSKKQAAGYVHSHGDRPATKIQSGYGGCSGPKR